MLTVAPLDDSPDDVASRPQFILDTMLDVICFIRIQPFANQLPEIIPNGLAEFGFVETLNLDSLDDVTRIDVRLGARIHVFFFEEEDHLHSIGLAARKEPRRRYEFRLFGLNTGDQIVSGLLIKRLPSKSPDRIANVLADLVFVDAGNLRAFDNPSRVHSSLLGLGRDQGGG
jgi:hypothetical protein